MTRPIASGARSVGRIGHVGEQDACRRRFRGKRCIVGGGGRPPIRGTQIGAKESFIGPTASNARASKILTPGASPPRPPPSRGRASTRAPMRGARSRGRRDQEEEKRSSRL